MKYLSLFILVLILCVVMALGSVLPGVTAYKEGAIERVADLNRGNTVSASRYSVSGDRHGIVTVKDAVSSEVIRTFKMDDGVVVRETFLLDGGKTVAASQKDHTIFWDLTTGKKNRRFPQRIYGFSPDEKFFFTYENKKLGTRGKVILYAYPSMKYICLLIETIDGPAEFQFSPNSRFIVIAFVTGWPTGDKYYPYPEPDYWRISTNIKLFNLANYQEILEFSELRLLSLGEFSLDSKFYYMKDLLVHINSGRGGREKGSWQFDLDTYQIKKIAN
jgi:hypothetical protein